jgi:hypothetical protein
MFTLSPYSQQTKLSFEIACCFVVPIPLIGFSRTNLSISKQEHAWCINCHYQKYYYRMHPIRSGSSWTTSKTLSTVVHIVQPISIIGGRVISGGYSCLTAADNTLNYQQWLRRWTAADNSVISSGSKPWPTADNGVYNQQWFIMRTASD